MLTVLFVIAASAMGLLWIFMTATAWFAGDRGAAIIFSLTGIVLGALLAAFAYSVA